MPSPRVDRPGAQQWVPSGRTTVEELREAAIACRGCELYADATQVVFSAGSPKARLMMVGEQPGHLEDLEGEPFVGPAGRLLQKALEAAGADADDVYVTNAVKHFRFERSGPGKRRIHRTPDLAHMVACAPWLNAELALVRPEVIVCLGAVGAKALLGKDFRVTQHRGEVLQQELPHGPTSVVATLHPAAVLRSKGADRDTAFEGLVEDLRIAWSVLRAG